VSLFLAHSFKMIQYCNVCLRNSTNHNFTILPSTPRSSGWYFIFRFHHKIHIPQPFILLHLINRIISDEGCMSWRFSLRNFRNPSVSSFLVGSSNFLSTKFSNADSLCVSPNVISSCYG